MSLDEIKELAGHREVSPWIVKLVQDAVESERERAAKVCEELKNPKDDLSAYSDGWIGGTFDCATAIRGMK